MRLVRDVLTPQFTLGRLYDGDLQLAFSIEDTVRGNGDPATVTEWKIPDVTAIPYGTYELAASYSTRFARVLPQIYNVPGFVGVRMHGGNTHRDTSGCVLLGLSRTADGVSGCAPAIEAVLALLGSKKVQFEVTRAV